MGFVYKITNKINSKVYVGKTELSVESRWKQHIVDSTKDRCKDRPLYRAIRKYGVCNFSIEVVEETSCTVEREIFWIAYYNSYKNGYNATKGGDGKTYVDCDLIVKLNSVGLSNKEIKYLTGYDLTTIRKYIINSGSKSIYNTDRNKPVLCVELGIVFDSQHDAAKFLKPNCKTREESSVANKVSQCCRSIRKSAYGYTWKYI
jgi:hypothetical protein